MKDIEAIAKWANIGAQIFNGIMQIVNVSMQESSGMISKTAVEDEIRAIDEYLSNAFARHSSIFENGEDTIPGKPSSIKSNQG